MGETPSIRLAISALPIEIPSQVVAKGPLETRGKRARRLVITFAPGSFKRTDALLWSRLSLRTYGGTIEAWSRVQSDGLLIDAVAPEGAASSRDALSSRARNVRRELAVVESGPGHVNVLRSAPEGAIVSNAVSIDLVLLPGGEAIDEPIVRIPRLWSEDGKALSPEEVQVHLESARHVPGFDTVDASVTVDYIYQQGYDGPVCRGSADHRTTIVDREGVRPPLWDLGISTSNVPRTHWLGFRSAETGVFRAIFDTPVAATSLANWIRATQSTRIGSYQLGLFKAGGGGPMRPLVPVDRDASDTFLPLAPEDMQWLRPGSLGER